MFGQADDHGSPKSYDLSEVQAAGELIAVTLSGPDTYYEYRGQGFGLQFALAQAFSNSIGARLRMEIAADTTQLLERLCSGEVDIIALEMDSSSVITSCLLLPNGWVIRRSSSELSEAVAQWWNPEIRTRLLAVEQAQRSSTNRVRRTLRPPMLSRQSGIISHYDEHFQRAARTVGWDWRLLAAQCYQESGFDPRAVSWAGACGLMQIMPSTGEHLGISRGELFDPIRNIEAAARYIVQLNTSFSDISDSQERICFVLAAYNGGAGHIRDAMALSQSEGHTPRRWSDVEPYVRLLSSPATYRNPLVKFGYLRGEETVGYVRQIRSRWAAYRGAAAPRIMGPTSAGRGPSRVRPRSDFLLDSLP